MSEHEHPPAVVLDGVTRRYGTDASAVMALRGVDCTIDAGELVALRGRSGSGKTTLLNIIGAIDRPSDGRVEVLGTDLGTLDEHDAGEWRRRNLGFVFQSHGLVASMTAFENVELALRISGTKRKERTGRAMEHLDLVGLTDWASHRPDELSGGQRQRVAIARATATEARLVIADEPTGELDVETGADVLALLRSIVDSTGTTLIVATHDPAVDDYADRILALRDGALT